MDIFGIISILITISAVFGYINIRFLKLPGTIGVMVISLISTIGLIILGNYTQCCLEQAETLMQNIDFKEVLLDVMLSFLLFAGALHTDLEQLKKQRFPIFVFATIGIFASTFLVGTLIFYAFGYFGFQISYINALLFGALISPTDPIAVLGILKKANVPKKLEIKIIGESLFNDGIGVVIFLTLFAIAQTGFDNVSGSDIAILFGQEVVGGIALGGLLGFLAYKMLKSIDHYETEVMITLALVMGTYYLASTLHLSGPLAVVVAGLFIGNRARRYAFSDLTERYVDKFWELVDVLLNAILFVLIGLELLVVTFSQEFVTAGLIAIPIVLMSRLITLGIPIGFFRKRLEFVRGTSLIMTWGGLRGGISIALALTLTSAMDRDIILTTTYIVVVFSILIQGLTLGGLVKKLAGKPNKPIEEIATEENIVVEEDVEIQQDEVVEPTETTDENIKKEE